MLVCILRFLFAKCRGKQESPSTFILSNKERKKAQKNSFFEIFLGSGGKIIERKSVSTLSISGYPQALRYLLILFSKIAFLCVCGFEEVFCLKGVSVKKILFFERASI